MAEGLRRGDFVVLAIPGDYGKPRPGLVVQNDVYSELGSVAICPTTTDIRTYRHFRIDVAPDAANGLERPTQIMIDKITAVERSRVRQVIGHADDRLMASVSVALSIFLAIG